MIDQTPPEHGLLATPDATSGEDDPAALQRLLPEPQTPKREAHVVLHDAPAEEDQDLLANDQLQALDVDSEVDYRNNHPEIDLGLWFKHACRPYLVNFTTKVPSYEVKRVTQDAEEHQNWIKDDLLRTGRVLFTLEFDEGRRVQVQKEWRVVRIGPRKRIFLNILKKLKRQQGAPQAQQSDNETGSVRSDGSDLSFSTANSNSSQTSESAMNDAEQTCAQFLRTLGKTRQKLGSDSNIFGGWHPGLEDALRRLEDSLKVHQDNAREIGFSKCD